MTAKTGLVVAALAFAWSTGVSAYDSAFAKCPPGGLCMDERGPMHPTFAAILSTLGLAVAAGAWAVRGQSWGRTGERAGGVVVLVLALLATLPLAIQWSRTDATVWVVPAAGLWITGVFLLSPHHASTGFKMRAPK